MTTLKIKPKSKAGGLKKTRKLRLSQSRLLDALWKKHNGPFETARIIGVHHQPLLNWRLRGFVPLNMLGTVARKLGVPASGLNYEGLAKLQGHAPEWKTVVESYGFPKDIEATILEGVWPKKLSEILK